MLALFYKIKLIKLLEKYGKWLYNKTNLYNNLLLNTEEGLKINYDFITSISYHETKRILEQIKLELEYLH